MDLNSFSLLGGERRLQDEQLETQNNVFLWFQNKPDRNFKKIFPVILDEVQPIINKKFD